MAVLSVTVFTWPEVAPQIRGLRGPGRGEGHWIGAAGMACWGAGSLHPASLEAQTGAVSGASGLNPWFPGPQAKEPAPAHSGRRAPVAFPETVYTLAGSLAELGKLVTML